MTGTEHYLEAEKCLKHVEFAANAERRSEDLAEAQVHATLALVAATREIGDQLDTVLRPLQPRVCQIPDCGCDGTWHS